MILWIQFLGNKLYFLLFLSEWMKVKNCCISVMLELGGWMLSKKKKICHKLWLRSNILVKYHLLENVNHISCLVLIILSKHFNAFLTWFIDLMTILQFFWKSNSHWKAKTILKEKWERTKFADVIELYVYAQLTDNT